jgi:hypothetical protein
MDPLADAWRIEKPYHTEYLGIPVFGVAHPGANGTRASGGPGVTTPRWQALGNFFKAVRNGGLDSIVQTNAVPTEPLFS